SWHVRSIAMLFLGLSLLAAIQMAEAGSATWRANPANGDWNQANNWNPRTVPNGTSDIATFSTTSQPSISLSAPVDVSEINFVAGANPFTITVPHSFFLTFNGAGVTNNSAQAQAFALLADDPLGAASVGFLNSATAGALTSFSLAGSAIDGNQGSYLQFYSASNAGSGSFDIHGSAFVGGGAFINFLDATSASTGT